MVTKEGFTKDVICITLKVGGFMLFIKILYSSTPYCRYSVKPYLIINQIESILVSGQTNWAIVSKEFDDPILWNLEELYFFCCLCVSLLMVFVPIENSSLMWRRHHYWWRGANFDLCSALMAIKQRVFFSVPHLHPFIIVVSKNPRHTSVAERLALEVSLPV